MIRVKMAGFYLGKKCGDDAQVRAGFPAEEQLIVLVRDVDELPGLSAVGGDAQHYSADDLDSEVGHRVHLHGYRNEIR